ncbi:transketolase [Betaproteobacteria bacterium]|nr:transketolase [Betaproteobacteria bacterium]
MRTMKDPRAGFGEALFDVALENDRILALSADSSGSSGLTPFKKRFPERHLEFGIMEQGIVGYASGLATVGWIPFFAAIAPFVTARPFEMFRNDLGYMKQNVKVVGRNAGLTYSDLGATHQSLDDVAILRTIPGVTVICPGDPVEITQAVRAAAKQQGPMYIRIGAQPMPVLHAEDLVFELGKGIRMADGGDVTIISTGTALWRAYDAIEILRSRGVQARLISMHTVKPIDKAIIREAARETSAIVTVEEHYLVGGLGSAVAEVIATEGLKTSLKMIGVDDQYASNGPYEELLGLYGLLAPQIAGAVEEFLSSRK